METEQVTKRKTADTHGDRSDVVVGRKPEAGPLEWWRAMPAEAFDAVAVATMREALSTIAIIDEPLWRKAAQGDAAAAIALALRLDTGRSRGTAFDLALTALAACAADSDDACALAMSHVVRRSPGADAGRARIAMSWLTLCFLRGMRRRGAPVEGRP